MGILTFYLQSDCKYSGDLNCHYILVKIEFDRLPLFKLEGSKGGWSKLVHDKLCIHMILKYKHILH